MESWLTQFLGLVMGFLLFVCTICEILLIPGQEVLLPLNLENLLVG